MRSLNRDTFLKAKQIGDKGPVITEKLERLGKELAERSYRVTVPILQFAIRIPMPKSGSEWAAWKSECQHVLNVYQKIKVYFQEKRQAREQTYVNYFKEHPYFRMHTLDNFTVDDQKQNASDIEVAKKIISFDPAIYPRDLPKEIKVVWLSIRQACSSYLQPNTSERYYVKINCEDIGEYFDYRVLTVESWKPTDVRVLSP